MYFPPQDRVDETQVAGARLMTHERFDDPAIPALAIGHVSEGLFRKGLGHVVDCVKDLVGEW